MEDGDGGSRLTRVGMDDVASLYSAVILVRKYWCEGFSDMGISARVLEVMFWYCSDD
jgi:hypothetical protein